MSEPDARVPTKGQEITVRWPGGPHDFRLRFERLDGAMPAPEPGWLWLHGAELYPDDHGYPRGLYARPTGDDGVYEMKAHGRLAPPGPELRRRNEELLAQRAARA